MVHSILARKRKENKDMEDKIKALTEKLRASEVEEGETEKRLAELKANNAEKVMTELDGGIKLSQAFLVLSAKESLLKVTGASTFVMTLSLLDMMRRKMGKTAHFLGKRICSTILVEVVV